MAKLDALTRNAPNAPGQQCRWWFVIPADLDTTKLLTFDLKRQKEAGVTLKVTVLVRRIGKFLSDPAPNPAVSVPSDSTLGQTTNTKFTIDVSALGVGDILSIYYDTKPGKAADVLSTELKGTLK
jgi:hypothetical protein